MKQLRQKINLLGVITVATVIGYKSLEYVPPSKTYQKTTGFSAPVLHLAAYAVLAASLKIYLHDRKRPLTKAIMGAVAFGSLMEIIQFFLVYRSFAIYDLQANAAGTLFVAADFRSAATSRLVRLEDRILEAAAELGSTFNVLDRA